jgi:ribosomal protein S18 acetylase RimI-like enzyme
MHFVTQPASSYTVSDLVTILNQGFEDYFIPIQFTNAMFVNMLHKDGIDLSASRVLLVDNKPSGIALIAPRAARRVSRLAAMGIAKELRGKGAGSWLMKKLVDEACERGDKEMVLEVIEQNEPAIRLYQSYGFESVRRLVGYTCRGKGVPENEKDELQPIDLRQVSQLISQYGVADLPWQLSGESLVQMKPPVYAYRREQAYIVTSNLEPEHVVIWSLLVEPQARGKGAASEILTCVLASYAGKTWHVPALCPEELGTVFERAGFEKETLSQWQMKRNLQTG